MFGQPGSGLLQTHSLQKIGDRLAGYAGEYAVEMEAGESGDVRKFIDGEFIAVMGVDMINHPLDPAQVFPAQKLLTRHGMPFLPSQKIAAQRPAALSEPGQPSSLSA